MPFTLNGTGTKYYGAREHDIGGTYITTKWIVVFGIPLLPLSSWRVYPLDEEHFHDHRPLLDRDASHTTQSFEETRVPLNLRQIINVYAITVPLLALAFWAIKRAFPGFSIKW
jgi:hypothetical protein